MCSVWGNPRVRQDAYVFQANDIALLLLLLFNKDSFCGTCTRNIEIGYMYNIMVLQYSINSDKDVGENYDL